MISLIIPIYYIHAGNSINDTIIDHIDYVNVCYVVYMIYDPINGVASP